MLFVHSKDSVKPDIALNLSKKDSKDQESIQTPHLSKGIKWESNKITINITSKSQEVSPFPSGDKAAINRRESMKNTR